MYTAGAYLRAQSWNDQLPSFNGNTATILRLKAKLIWRMAIVWIILGDSFICCSRRWCWLVSNRMRDMLPVTWEISCTP